MAATPKTAPKPGKVRKTLFFLHLPKCAGMSLTDALLDRLPARAVYQSTSMIRNYLEGRPEFLEIRHPGQLRAVVGHWVHEAMLPTLHRPLYFATSLRDPVARTRSQYRFDVGMRGGHWADVSEAEFLKRNANVMSNFLLRAFPSIAREYSNKLDGAKAILAGFDCAFDISEADEAIPFLVKVAGGGVTPVPRTNESSAVKADLSMSDDDIRSYQDVDTPLYEWFKTYKSPEKRERNPVFSTESRDLFGKAAWQPFNADTVAEFLAPKYAAELFHGHENLRPVTNRLNHQIAFLQRVQAQLSRRSK